MSAYATVEQADLYHTARPTNAAWAALDLSNKQALLLIASDYIDVAYSFSGYKTDTAQERQFPRDGYTEIPANVIAATCVLALIGSENDLMSDVERLESRVTVGPITVEYKDNAAIAWGDGRSRYVDMLLRELLGSGKISVGRGRMMRG